MVGLVIVSHSATLAEGVRELAAQMVQGTIAITTAGGIDDPENPIGTDAVKVLNAIEEAYSDSGVVVLMDLGSAVLSAETALEFLPPEMSKNVRLCPAPLIEGAVAAAVQASLGSSLDEVEREALSALEPKRQQLPGAFAEPVESSPSIAPAPAVAVTTKLIIANEHGLHARPAARFVSTANRFDATVVVRKGDREANAKSINQIATLGVRQGDEITVEASGLAAEAAIEALEELVRSNFGEEREPATVEQSVTVVASTKVSATEAVDLLTGIAASPGTAIGPAARFRKEIPAVEAYQIDSPQKEWEQLQQAMEVAYQEIDRLRASTEQRAGAAEAEIFSAHQLILQDPTLSETVRDRLVDEKLNAGAIWQQELEELALHYEALDDPYMQARAADVRDVMYRVLRILAGGATAPMALDEPAIIVARDLSPSDTANLDLDLVLGLCTEEGGATSHSAILARAYGIPAAVGFGPALGRVEDGQIIALDGNSGTLNLAPTAADAERLREQQAEWETKMAEARKSASMPAITLDGHGIEVAANIGGPDEVRRALEFGAEGIGLFRTEFLFLDRSDAPGEEEQFRAYHTVAEAMGARPVIVRTLDIGGDKPLPYLDLGQEANPFLGWRGIRFCLDRPDVFVPQLRAILRAGYGHNLKVMFPMVSTVAEVLEARAVLEDARNQLVAEGISVADKMEVGIMIEVPSAVAIADKLAQAVDFFSIGTNDLTQYTMAADRGNARVADLADPLQPALLRLVQQTVVAAHNAGIWVGMCGELAGDPLATEVLTGLGLDELSMNAPAVPMVKASIRKIRIADAIRLAGEAVALGSAEAVRSYLSGPKT